MKTLVLAVFIMVSGWCWGETDYNILADTIADTTILHDVKVIDEHLVVTDSIIIERTIIQWYEGAGVEHRVIQRLVAFFVVGLVLLSLICHYLKNKNNGTKIH